MFVRIINLFPCDARAVVTREIKAAYLLSYLLTYLRTQQKVVICVYDLIRSKVFVFVFVTNVLVICAFAICPRH